MDKNKYLEILLKSVKNPTSLSVESIEGLLGHVADMHNAMGKSYEYLVSIIQALLQVAGEANQNESNQKKSKEYEKEVQALKSKLRELEMELERAREKIVQFERDSQKKDENIQDLKSRLEKVNEKTVNPQRDFNFLKLDKLKEKPQQPDLGFIRSFDTQKDPPVQEEISNKNKKALDSLFSQNEMEMLKKKYESDEITKLKRKYDDLLPPSVQIVDFDEDGEKSSSTTTNQKENSNTDDQKFRKVFKKVKKTEKSQKTENSKNNKNGNGHSTSTPLLSNVNKRKSDFTADRPSNVNFEEDDTLHGLLGNFIEDKGSKAGSNNSSKSFTTRATKKDEMNISTDKETKSRKTDPMPKNFLDAENSKVYKKTAGLAFSQQSPLKGLELSASHDLTSIPITRIGRSGMKNETKNNLMQRMFQGNKKRNSVEPSQTLKVSTKKDEEKNNLLNIFNDEDLVRTSHRSKAEREGLQGFDCDQCSKFYNFIADGIHIKSAAEHCDNCSRHRDKFPLPATPEGFHKNFTLNSQD